MGIYGGPVSYTRGSGGAAIAAQISRQVSGYAASGAIATAERAAKQEAKRVLDAQRYARAAAAGQVTVYTRTPRAGTAAARAQVLNILIENARKGIKIEPFHEERFSAELTAARKEFAKIDAATAAAKAKAEAEAAAADAKTGTVTDCPRGLRYTKLTRWSNCDPGYVSTKGSGLSILGQDIYPLWPGNECVCISTEAGMAIVKTESEPKPGDLPGNGEEKGIKDVLGALAKGEININSVILAAAVVMLIISLIKR